MGDRANFKQTQVRQMQNPNIDTIESMLAVIEIPRDELLHQQLCYGNAMSVVEAHLRLDMLFEKSDRMRQYASAIRRYQRKHQISALQWGTIEYCGRSIRVCSIHEMMSPTRSDVQAMRENKREIIRFLSDVQRYFKTWCWDGSKPSYQEWQVKSWESVLDDLKQCYWIALRFNDCISATLDVTTGEK
jgi:hypothetical protein